MSTFFAIWFPAFGPCALLIAALWAASVIARKAEAITSALYDIADFLD